MRRLALVIALGALVWPAGRVRAGEWSCGAQEFHLDRAPARREAAKPEQRAWADQLGARGRPARAVDLFVPSQATLSPSADSQPCRVYQSADAEPDAFLVVCSVGTFHVDFAHREIVSLGTALASVLEASDRSASVVQHGVGTRIGGVPVGALCPASPYWVPWFREREVWWR